MNVITEQESKVFLQHNLSKMMQSEGWGVRALAAQSENDPMTISRIINHGTIPRADKLLRIAYVLNTTMEQLFKSTSTARKKIRELSKISA